MGFGIGMAEDPIWVLPRNPSRFRW